MPSTAVSVCSSTVTLSIVALSYANKIMNLKQKSNEEVFFK